MCHINTRRKIQTKTDINSLIVGLINRQCMPFTEKKIIELASYHSVGSQITFTRPQLERIVGDRLDTLERNGFLRYNKGLYYPKLVVDYL